jgi:hypothetical protein
MKRAIGVLGSILCFASCGTDGMTGVDVAESEQVGQRSESLTAGAAVLFVVGNTTLSAGDSAIRTRLQGLGATVTVRGAAAATTADAQGKALIVISESVTSTDVNTKFRDGAVPVVCLEPALFDDFRMAGTVQNTDYGQAASQTELELIAVSHPLAAGLTVPISSTAGAFSWARPAQGAIRIGKIVGSSDQMGIFAFDAGQALTSGVAPGRRVGWLASASLPTTLTKQGWQLFDDAVNWSASACTATPQATACAGKSCGTVSNGCGGTHNCGTCASPMSCGGAGTANVCGCTKTPMATACSGKACGLAPDGCGGTYTCGTCSSSSAPICVSNTCKQCAAVSDCPTGTFSCSNNTCACRLPASANLIKDGGFDTSSTLSSWTSSQTTWLSGDADACPASGSITTTGSISRCFQVPQVPAGGSPYSLGLRYKSSGGCFGSFHPASNCTQSSGTADFLNLAVGPSSTWSSGFTTNTAPEGTQSIQVQCFTSSSLTIDQIFLGVAGPAGPGF